MRNDISRRGLIVTFNNRAATMGYRRSEAGDIVRTMIAGTSVQATAELLEHRSGAYLDSGAHEEHGCEDTSIVCGEKYAVSEAIECFDPAEYADDVAAEGTPDIPNELCPHGIPVLSDGASGCSVCSGLRYY
jgi:hypothetical protein